MKEFSDRSAQYVERCHIYSGMLTDLFMIYDHKPKEGIACFMQNTYDGIGGTTKTCFNSRDFDEKAYNDDYSKDDLTYHMTVEELGKEMGVDIEECTSLRKVMENKFGKVCERDEWCIDMIFKLNDALSEAAKYRRSLAMIRIQLSKHKNLSIFGKIKLLFNSKNELF